MKTNHRIRLWLALLALSTATAHAQLSFTTNTYSVGGGPAWVVAVDVNGDGKLDLVSADYGTFVVPGNTLTVLTNDGSATFGSNTTLTVGSGPASLVAANINGDGKPDLISADFWSDTLTVLTNNGSGFGFQATLKGVGSGPSCVVAADLNGDGKPDLVSADWFGNTLSVLTNTGSGGFGFKATLQVGSEPQGAVALDVNGDGKLDLVSANYGANTLTVLTNDGYGGFGSNATLNGGLHPWGVMAADVNGDGKLDLISANTTSAGTLTVLTNNGSGGFGSNATFNVGPWPGCVVAADVNGDGKLDLITANVGYESAGHTLTVVTNNGSGGFGSNATLNVGGGPQYVLAADVNGDGKVDLISANSANGHVNTLTVLLNTTPFLPSLNVALAGQQLVLYWPAWATNYALQSETGLAVRDWAAVTNSTWQGTSNGVAVIGVTVTETSPARFFRLQSF